ncbi:MAG TPA: carboxyl transferase domain-containing protein, partial [Ottowia sp.]|nr:carboxyl transferase domain-containing protein [Ottowia sp.]
MSAQQGQTLAPAGEWAAELAELQQRRASALAMGGAQALARMRDSGRMNARERIAALIDQGSFHEMGTLAGKGHYDAQGRYSHTDPTNAIVGTGRIDGRKVALHVDDYSIRAGSSEGTIADKWIYIERLAHQLRM